MLSNARAATPRSVLAFLVRRLGTQTLRLVELCGALALVSARTLLCLSRIRGREFLRALNLYGYRSLPLALGAAALIGAIVVLQAGVYADRLGVRLYLGWAAGYALLWEFGPLLLGLVMAGRIGARNASELALLTVNGQVEALRGISLDPFAVLVAPRVVASALSVLTLSSVTFAVAILWEAIAAFFALNLPLRNFLASLALMLRWGDLAGGMVKSAAFGLAIAIISTALGLGARGGARGVGRATASAVVASGFSIFLLDFLLTPWLSRMLGPS